MRKALLAAAFLVASAGAASAQLSATYNQPTDGLLRGSYNTDYLPTHKQPAAPYLSPEPAANWSGSYVGGMVGLSDTDRIGAAIGVRAGYNWQYGRFVYGVESDFNYRPYNPSISSSGGDGLGNTYVANASAKANTISTLTARFGYLYDDRTLAFVTTGPAYNVSAVGQTLTGTTGPNAGAFGGSSAKGFMFGWSFGFGAEYKLTKNWSVLSQYQYNWMPSQHLVTTAMLGGAAVQQATFDFAANGGSLATLGVNYHF